MNKFNGIGRMMKPSINNQNGYNKINGYSNKRHNQFIITPAYSHTIW